MLDCRLVVKDKATHSTLTIAAGYINSLTEILIADELKLNSYKTEFVIIGTK